MIFVLGLKSQEGNRKIKEPKAGNEWGKRHASEKAKVQREKIITEASGKKCERGKRKNVNMCAKVINIVFV